MTPPITICLTYFKSLTLAHLRAALYSVRQQDMTFVNEIIIVDNDTKDDAEEVQRVIDETAFNVQVRSISVKHGDAARTHSWSTNLAVREVQTPWVFFTRADYLLDARMLKACVDVAGAKPNKWNGFVTSYGYHLMVDIAVCEQSRWRADGASVFRALPGSHVPYTLIDTGVWLARKDAFEAIGGMNEQLSAWGHAQTDLQYRLHKADTEFVQVPEVLFYHPQHDAPRKIYDAHQQLLAVTGVDVKTMWARYEGEQPYR